MDLQTKPVKATASEYDGSLATAPQLMTWIQRQGFQFSSQALQMDQASGLWVVALTYFKPKPEGSTPKYENIRISKGFVVCTTGKDTINQYTTEQALYVDFDQVQA